MIKWRNKRDAEAVRKANQAVQEMRAAVHLIAHELDAVVVTTAEVDGGAESFGALARTAQSIARDLHRIGTGQE